MVRRTDVLDIGIAHYAYSESSSSLAVTRGTTTTIHRSLLYDVIEGTLCNV